jgi:putative NADH-flavin reductase
MGAHSGLRRQRANWPPARGQAIDAGHEVVAVTRHLEQVPSRDRLAVLGCDVTDPAAVDAAVAGGDAVLSVLGVPYSPKPAPSIPRQIWREVIRNQKA